jgi:predicted DNA-binding protein YlxM (UPF0122 family)/5-methylcytosine-specific restriction endonuclease McrA
MIRPKDIKKETLQKLYYEEEKTLQEIANIFNCSKNSIVNIMKKYNLKRRVHTLKPIGNKELLNQLYTYDNLSLSEIGRIFNCANHTIKAWLKRFNISIRESKDLNITKEKLDELYSKKELSISKITVLTNSTKSKVLTKMNAFGIKRRTYSDATKITLLDKDVLDNKIKVKINKNELYKLYSIDELSPHTISKIYNCCTSTISKKLKKFNIKIRTISESMKLIRKRGNNNPNFKYGLPKCVDCGKELSHYYNTRCKKCSMKYYVGENHPFFGRTHKDKTREKISKSKKGNYLGKNNPNYIDGRSPLRILIRGIDEYKNWRKNIFERDNYTCQNCGIAKSGYLEVHHIKAFAIILDEFLKKFDRFSPIEDKETLLKLAMDYEPFWNINNGQTLCEDCHNKTKNGRTTVQIKNQEI